MMRRSLDVRIYKKSNVLTLSSPIVFFVRARTQMCVCVCMVNCVYTHARKLSSLSNISILRLYKCTLFIFCFSVICLFTTYLGMSCYLPPTTGTSEKLAHVHITLLVLVLRRWRTRDDLAGYYRRAEEETRPNENIKKKK